MEEHKKLDLEIDRNLINKILEDLDSRYILLYLYIIRKNLFKDLEDEKLIDGYNHVLSLDTIYKGNIHTFLPENFAEIASNLGIFRNIRHYRDFENKDQDFIIKLGNEPIVVQEDVVLVPANTLFNIITRKFNSITKRDFNLALSRLKGVRCEATGTIHPFLYEVGKQNYMLSKDLYEIFDKFGNVYRTIQVELTIENFYKRFDEIYTRVLNLLDIYNIIVDRKDIIKKINQLIKSDGLKLNYLDIKTKEKEEKKILDFKEINLMIKIDSDRSVNLNLPKDEYEGLLTQKIQYDEVENELIEMRKSFSNLKSRSGYLEVLENIEKKESYIDERLRSMRELIIGVKERLDIFEERIKKINK